VKKNKETGMERLLTQAQIKARDRERMYRKALLLLVEDSAEPLALADVKLMHGSPQMNVEQWYWLIRRGYLQYVDSHSYSRDRKASLTAKGHAMIMSGDFNFIKKEMSLYVFFFTEICYGRGRDVPKWKY